MMASVGRDTFRLTSKGHDFLEAVRDDGIWQKTKDGVAAVGGATLGIVSEIAIAYVKQKVTEKLGIQL